MRVLPNVDGLPCVFLAVGFLQLLKENTDFVAIRCAYDRSVKVNANNHESYTAENWMIQWEGMLVWAEEHSLATTRPIDIHTGCE